MNIIIRSAETRDYPAILRMNAADVDMLSPIDEGDLHRMEDLLELFLVAEVDGCAAGFLMACRAGSAYWSDNYLWVCAHYPTFLYVDRIVIDERYRKYGFASRLYAEVYRHAERENIPLITAEIDIAPMRNDASLAFHQRQGFHEVGTKLYRGNVSVSLQARKMKRED